MAPPVALPATLVDMVCKAVPMAWDPCGALAGECVALQLREAVQEVWVHPQVSVVGSVVVLGCDHRVVRWVCPAGGFRLVCAGRLADIGCEW